MKKIAACGVFLAAFAVYLFTLVPCLTEDDSGELAGAGATLGTAHSPGYPLYTLAAKAVATAVPLGNSAYRVNAVSALFIAGTAAVIFIAAAELTGSMPAAAACALLFSFSGLVWAMANVTEVYGIAAFAAALVCFSLIRSFRGGESAGRWLYFAAFTLGLGIAAHYTLGLLLPGFLYALFAHRKDVFGEKPLRRLGAVAACFLAGLSVLAYLYVRGRTNPVFGWEDPDTLERWWQVVARLRYGTLALAQGGAPPLSASAVFAKMLFYAEMLAGTFTWAGVLLFALGVAYSLKDRGRGWTFLLMLLGCGPGFLVMANVGLDDTSRELLERFFFLSFIFVVFVLAEALGKLPRAFQGLAAAIPVFLLFQNYPRLDHRQEYLYGDYARNMLRTLPRGSLLFADRADEMEFSIAYLHLARGMRPDIEFVDCNAGVTRSIYGDRYYRIWGEPRLRMREAVERERIERRPGPVYYATFFPDMVKIPRYREGLLFRAKPQETVLKGFPYGEIYALRLPERLDGRSRGLVLSHYQLLGEYYLLIRRPEKARESFDAVLRLDETGRSASSIGFMYHRQGYPADAELYYRKAIERGKAGSDVFTNLGVLYKDRGKRDDALKCYEQAVAIDPANVQAHSNLAALYWEQARWRDVVREYETILKIQPDNRQAQTYLQMAKENVNK